MNKGRQFHWVMEYTVGMHAQSKTIWLFEIFICNDTQVCKGETYKKTTIHNLKLPATTSGTPVQIRKIIKYNNNNNVI